MGFTLLERNVYTHTKKWDYYVKKYRKYMDNLRFKTSKLKIPFYCIKNEIIDDYCIFVNLTQLLHQFPALSTREPPPQHFLTFYSHIFIEDFISKYHFHLLYSLVFLTIKDRMIETKS